MCTIISIWFNDFSWLCNDFRNRLRDFSLTTLHIIEIIIVTLPHKNRKY